MYPPVLPQANVNQHILNTLLNINNALYQFNYMTGFGTPFPEEGIKFDMLVVDQFQELPVVTQGATTTTDNSTQTTTHGETANTTDGDQTELIGYDPSLPALSLPGDYTTIWPTVGRQAQPFPL